eukprot:jgi/Mesvir1/21790/Mv04182-RA.1
MTRENKAALTNSAAISGGHCTKEGKIEGVKHNGGVGCLLPQGQQSSNRNEQHPSWDDLALVNAYENAIHKYQTSHFPEFSVANPRGEPPAEVGPTKANAARVSEVEMDRTTKRQDGAGGVDEHVSYAGNHPNGLDLYGDDDDDSGTLEGEPEDNPSDAEQQEDGYLQALQEEDEAAVYKEDEDEEVGVGGRGGGKGGEEGEEEEEEVEGLDDDEDLYEQDQRQYVEEEDVGEEGDGEEHDPGVDPGYYGQHWHASTSPAKAMGQHPGAYNGMDEVAARVAALQVSGQGHDFLPAGPGYFPGPGVGPWDWHAPTHPFRAGEYVQGAARGAAPEYGPTDAAHGYSAGTRVYAGASSSAGTPHRGAMAAGAAQHRPPPPPGVSASPFYPHSEGHGLPPSPALAASMEGGAFAGYFSRPPRAYPGMGPLHPHEAQPQWQPAPAPDAPRWAPWAPHGPATVTQPAAPRQQRLRGLALAYVAGVAGVPGGAYPWVPLGGGARYVAPARPAPNPNWQGGEARTAHEGAYAYAGGYVSPGADGWSIGAPPTRLYSPYRGLFHAPAGPMAPGGRHPPPPWDASSPYDAMPLDSYFPWADGELSRAQASSWPRQMTTPGGPRTGGMGYQAAIPNTMFVPPGQGVGMGARQVADRPSASSSGRRRGTHAQPGGAPGRADVGGGREPLSGPSLPRDGGARGMGAEASGVPGYGYGDELGGGSMADGVGEDDGDENGAGVEDAGDGCQGSTERQGSMHTESSGGSDFATSSSHRQRDRTGAAGAEDEGGSGPPPPPPPFAPLPDDMELANLLMAWYYAGFYTARYSKKHPLKR